MQAAASQALVRLSCERLDSQGAELFGRGSKPGLLQLLCAAAQQPGAGAEESPGGSQALPGAAAPLLLGTLLLDNAHKLAQQTQVGHGVDMAVHEAEWLRLRLEMLQALARLQPLPDAHRPTSSPRTQQQLLSKTTAEKYMQGKAGSGGGGVEGGSQASVLTSSAPPLGGGAGGPGGAGGAGGFPQDDVSSTGTEAAGDAAAQGKAAGGKARERLRVDLLAVVPGLRSALRSDLWPEAINFKV
ncbi:hypothetical protein HaLaN_03773, partial [Haematococcus lacustris]